MLYWNPDHYFRIPIFGWEISWYFFFWDLGSVIAFFVAVHQIYRYRLNFPDFLKIDIKRNCSDQEAFLKQLNTEIEKINDKTNDEKVYQGFEVLSIAKILKRKELEKKYQDMVFSVVFFALRNSFFVFSLIGLCASFGLRFIDVIFYQKNSAIFQTPWELFYIWMSGKSSHGGILGFCFAAWLYVIFNRKNFLRLNWLKLMDLLTPGLWFAGFFMRLGNMFTQEILGTETSMPWGVVFGHPVDRSLPIPLHPVQLYEAIAYFAIAMYLLYLSRRLKFMLGDGKIFGLGTILAFSARFFLEFFKQEQSRIIDPDSIITMGQILSIPFIVLGFCVYYKSEIIAFFKSKSFSFGKTAED